MDVPEGPDGALDPGRGDSNIPEGLVAGGSDEPEGEEGPALSTSLRMRVSYSVPKGNYSWKTVEEGHEMGGV